MNTHSLADSTLPLRLQGCEHNDDGVVSRRSFDKPTELVPVHPNDRTFTGPVHHLAHLLREQGLGEGQRLCDREWVTPYSYSVFAAKFDKSKAKQNSYSVTWFSS